MGPYNNHWSGRGRGWFKTRWSAKKVLVPEKHLRDWLGCCSGRECAWATWIGYVGVCVCTSAGSPGVGMCAWQRHQQTMSLVRDEMFRNVLYIFLQRINEKIMVMCLGEGGWEGGGGGWDENVSARLNVDGKIIIKWAGNVSFSTEMDEVILLFSIHLCSNGVAGTGTGAGVSIRLNMKNWSGFKIRKKNIRNRRLEAFHHHLNADTKSFQNNVRINGCSQSLIPAFPIADIVSEHEQ